VFVRTVRHYFALRKKPPVCRLCMCSLSSACCSGVSHSGIVSPSLMAACAIRKPVSRGSVSKLKLSLFMPYLCRGLHSSLMQLPCPPLFLSFNKGAKMAKKAASVAIPETIKNKSQLVREYMATNPGAKPKDIVAALSHAGVTIGTVNSVKQQEKAKGGTSKRGNAPSNGLDIVKEAALFVLRYGGDVKKAKAAVEKLAADPVAKFATSIGGVAAAVAAIDSLETNLAE
jgi:hypothetical protein